MIFNLIIGVLAGIASRYVETPLNGFIKDKVDIPEPDMRVLAFIVTLLAASLLIGVAGVNGMPIVLLIGGGLGIFGSHVMKFSNAQKDVLKAKMEERKNGAAETVETVEEAVKETKTAAKRKTTAKKPAAKK